MRVARLVATVVRPRAVLRHSRATLRAQCRAIGTSSASDDERFMRMALEEARVAGDKGEVPVGAVLVGDDGEVIAKAHNLVEMTTDPTAHAELLCLRQASRTLQSWRLLQTTLFVTLEPCPMCAGALLQSRVKRVVWGAPNKQLGADGSWISILKSDTLKHPYHLSVNVSRNVLEEECSLLLRAFFTRRRAEQAEKSKQDGDGQDSR